MDDNFTLLVERALKICDMLIERGFDLRWRLENGIRADPVTPPLLRRMREAGCYRVAFGIESGNPEVHRRMNKGEPLAQIRQAVEWARAEDLETQGFFILGNDGDNEKTMMDTISLARELDLDIAQFGVHVPLPGTPYTEKILEEGRIYQVPWRNYNAFNQPIFEHGELPLGLMSRMQKQAYRQFYFRPRFFVRKLVEVRSFQHVKGYVDAALGILKMVGSDGGRGLGQ